jgi:hypothetical protein
MGPQDALETSPRASDLCQLLGQLVDLYVIRGGFEPPQEGSPFGRRGDNGHTRSLTKYAPLGALAIALAGCGGVDLDQLRNDSRPYYWLGKAFHGLPLTHAEPYITGRASFIYGDCEAKSDMGCAPPLEVQNVRCASGAAMVTIYGRRQLADHASGSLRPLNEAAHNAGRPLIGSLNPALC